MTDRLIIPASLAAELTDVWVLPTRDPSLDTRTAVGDRGELYSYRYEQMLAEDPSKIRWVARDDDSLGYDIEDLNRSPYRRIEAKASAGQEPRFFLSRHEWDVAHSEASLYEIHFWGGVNLNRPAREEFARLRKDGYPIIYRDLTALLSGGSLTAVAWQWLISERRDEETG